MMNSHINEVVSGENTNEFNNPQYLHIKDFGDHYFTKKVKPIQLENYLTRDVQKRNDVEKLSREYEKRFQSLLHQFITIEELQRESIASDLHDRTIQSLAGTQIKLGALQKFTCEKSLKKLIDEIRDDIDIAINDIRTLILEIDSPVLEEGLLMALEWFVDQIRKENDVQITFLPTDEINDLTEPLKTFVYRSVRELVLNAVKHASASEITISVQNKKSYMQFCIVDNGIGFDADKISSYAKNGHFGLYHMTKRIKHYNGSLKIRSKCNDGTHVFLTFPMQFENALDIDHQGILYENKNTCGR